MIHRLIFLSGLVLLFAAQPAEATAVESVRVGFAQPYSQPLSLLGTATHADPATYADPVREQVLQLLQSRDNQIKSILGPEGSEPTDEQRSVLKDLINGIIDFEAMARFALQATYDTIRTEQRNEFVSLFGTIIRDQSLVKLDIYRAQVRYDAVEQQGETVRVSTTATYQDVSTPVYYALARKADGWVITDFSIDDVSTAESYRRQFQSILRQRSFDALLESLRRRAARVTG